MGWIFKYNGTCLDKSKFKWKCKEVASWLWVQWCWKYWRKERKKQDSHSAPSTYVSIGVNVDECWCKLFLYWADRTIYSPTYFPLKAENGAPNQDQNTLLIPAEIMSIQNGSFFSQSTADFHIADFSHKHWVLKRLLKGILFWLHWSVLFSWPCRLTVLELIFQFCNEKRCIPTAKTTFLVTSWSLL